MIQSTLQYTSTSTSKTKHLALTKISRTLDKNYYIDINVENTRHMFPSRQRHIDMTTRQNT